LDISKPATSLRTESIIAVMLDVPVPLKDGVVTDAVVMQGNNRARSLATIRVTAVSGVAAAP
jgi:hypothetical protein